MIAFISLSLSLCLPPLSIYISMYPSILPICLFLYLYIHPSVYQSIHLLILPSIHLSKNIRPSVHLEIHPFIQIYPSIYPTIYRSIHPFITLSLFLSICRSLPTSQCYQLLYISNTRQFSSANEMYLISLSSLPPS